VATTEPHDHLPPDTAAGGAPAGTAGGPADSTVGKARRSALNEDWAATIAGLLLLGLVLTGLVPGWLVP
jgi:hypothetical protein